MRRRLRAQCHPSVLPESSLGNTPLLREHSAAIPEPPHMHPEYRQKRLMVGNISQVGLVLGLASPTRPLPPLPEDFHPTNGSPLARWILLLKPWALSRSQNLNDRRWQR